MRYPKNIQASINKGRQAQAKVNSIFNFPDPELHPKRGPKPTSNAKKVSIIAIGDTIEETIDIDILNKLELAIGPSMRGNKRRGRLQFYTDLAIQFNKLQVHGITLPRNKSLSGKACSHGLGQILRNYGHTKHSDSRLLKDRPERLRIANKLSRVFHQVALAVENSPAKIS